MIRIAVCDDDPNTINTLETFFDNTKDFYYDVFVNSKNLSEIITNNSESYHIYILDIEMPYINGLDLARLIRKNNFTSLIIFVTSHDQYTFEAFDIGTFNYLVKPIDLDKLHHQLNKAKKHLQQIKKIFCFQYNHKCYSVDFERILYIEKFKRQNTLHMIDHSQHVFNMTLCELNSLLDNDVFIHVQRSTIVNLQHVLKISDNFVYLRELDQPIYISKKYIVPLKNKHLAYAKIKL